MFKVHFIQFRFRLNFLSLCLFFPNLIFSLEFLFFPLNVFNNLFRNQKNKKIIWKVVYDAKENCAITERNETISFLVVIHHLWSQDLKALRLAGSGLFLILFTSKADPQSLAIYLTFFSMKKTERLSQFIFFINKPETWTHIVHQQTSQ